MADCDVCIDGWYLIVDQKGRDRYEIKCPECHGAYRDAIDDSPKRREADQHDESQPSLF